MRGQPEAYDMTSVGVVAVVAIVCVLLIVLNLAPGSATAAPDASAAGRAVSYGDAAVPITAQFDFSAFDFNGDGRLDYYDYEDVLAGRVDCQAKDCDLNDDGLVDGQDQALFDALVRRLYDYDGDGKLTRDDPLVLRRILLSGTGFDGDHVYDLDGDGLLTSHDLSLYTSLLYNYDNPS